MTSQLIFTLLSVMSVALIGRARYQTKSIQELEDVGTPHIGEPPQWPRLSIIVPARDEEETVSAAMHTLLQLDYPNYEIIAVNDRSSDRTGELLDELASTSERLRVIHLTTLPTGWLGKLHALDQGTRVASGELLLFADADIHFEPRLLKSTVSQLEGESLDYLTLIPRIIGESSALKGMIFLFATLFCLKFNAREVNQDDTDAYVGIGVFQLVRAHLFEQTEGWEWLRLEIADDTGLAYLCHRHHARARLYSAIRGVSVRWYASVPEMVRGLEKNLFPVTCRFSLGRAVALSLMMLLLSSSPLILIFLGSWKLGGIFLVTLLGVLCTQDFEGVTWWERGLAYPMWFVLTWALIRSAWKTWRQGGIYWRDTFYSIEELRANQRVKL